MTASTAAFRTSARLLRSLYLRWMSEVATKVWMRGRLPHMPLKSSLIAVLLALCVAALAQQPTATPRPSTTAQTPTLQPADDEREVDFVQLRQRLAEGARWNEDLIREIAPWVDQEAKVGK